MGNHSPPPYTVLPIPAGAGVCGLANRDISDSDSISISKSVFSLLIKLWSFKYSCSTISWLLASSVTLLVEVTGTVEGVGDEGNDRLGLLLLFRFELERGLWDKVWKLPKMSYRVYINKKRTWE